ncbi:hypothetical protein M407DRAFT_32025 [Tulasnella calospora MUT 4182]|uniref:Uncharacterized protein n=1 Tax=Tulasnella calospora MUT 4182 TaxID=1051891 RepID=A0A0C3LA24_9AGAM|nr:hypothetical protein M407DRAFT_32025 [Tulasnella calospora MUT 4182]
MLPSTSTSKHIIFDGTDNSISFLDFVQVLENSPHWVGITAFLVFWDMEHVVPTHLYGEALRYYETLDPDCQQDWSELRDAMARRFPGSIRSGGLVRRSTLQWDEYGLPTTAESPPVTSARLAVPATEVDEPKNSGPGERVLKPKRSSPSLSSLRGRLRMPSFSQSPSRTATETPPLEPYVTVHSMFIDYAHGGVKWSPLYHTVHATVDLTDPQAVAAAKRAPLITIPSSDDNESYRVGFTYTVLRDERVVDFCHKVLAPRRFKLDYFQQTGEQTVSPTRQSSEAFPVTNIIYDHKSPYFPRKKSPPGRYTIQSHLRSRTPGKWEASEIEHVGEITWILQVV